MTVSETNRSDRCTYLESYIFTCWEVGSALITYHLLIPDTVHRQWNERDTIVKEGKISMSDGKFDWFYRFTLLLLRFVIHFYGFTCLFIADLNGNDKRPVWKIMNEMIEHMFIWKLMNVLEDD